MNTDNVLEEIESRFQRALALVPGKGERPTELYDALVDSASDIPVLVRMIRVRDRERAELLHLIGGDHE